MEDLYIDLPRVAVFQDDTHVSEQDANDHLNNLRRLNERSRREKYLFALPSVEYLGYTLSAKGIAQGPKVEVVMEMLPPTDVSSLKSSSSTGSSSQIWLLWPSHFTERNSLEVGR